MYHHTGAYEDILCLLNYFKYRSWDEKMASDNPVKEIVDTVGDSIGFVFEALGEYGSLITDGLYLVLGSILLIYIVQRFTSKVAYRRVENKRFLRVFFGTIYVLAIVIIALLILEELDVPVEGFAELAIAAVLIGAVLVFFLIPFLPKLPFLVGHIVEIGGIFGVVSAIDVFRVKIRKLDGSVVSITSAAAMASQITNFSETPYLRIEMKLSIDNDCDLEKVMRTVHQLMKEDARVLGKPSKPFTHIKNATASGVEMSSYCWVKNEDWLEARTDLWLRLVHVFSADETISMSLPQQEVFVHSIA